jgi:two-component system, CAI-1 autoinducer sensor kinase/phosphatase CqsS
MAKVHCTQVAPTRNPLSGSFPTASFCHEMHNYLQLLSVQAQCIAHADSRGEREAQLARQMELLSDSTQLLNMYMYQCDLINIGSTELTNFKILPVIRQVIRAYPRLAAQIDISIGAEFSIHANQLLLKSVLHNLMRNAWRALEVKPDMLVHIVLAADRKGKYLSFIDTGTGIQAKHLESIFTPLVSYSAGGTGLGLAICRHSMEIFGGSIECASEYGKYTVFKLRF